MGVWIETWIITRGCYPSLCHTLHGCVDWNPCNLLAFRPSLGHTLHGCVDWNFLWHGGKKVEQSHTLHGCVDWNIFWATILYRFLVTPFMGVWIETSMYPNRYKVNRVTPFMGVWIETNILPHVSMLFVSSHPSWVCGLKLETIKVARVKLGHTLHGCVDWNSIGPLFKINSVRHTLHGCVDWNVRLIRWIIR